MARNKKNKIESAPKLGYEDDEEMRNQIKKTETMGINGGYWCLRNATICFVHALLV
jgi:hypothetical protein